MIEKEFIPYEQALALKELGFDEECLSTIDQTDYIHIKGTKYPIRGAMCYLETDCPTFSQAFRWFREKYNLLGTPQYFYGGFYCYTVNDMKDTKESNRLFSEFETFEEAEIACLKKLIEIVKK